MDNPIYNFEHDFQNKINRNYLFKNLGDKKIEKEILKLIKNYILKNKSDLNFWECLGFKKSNFEIRQYKSKL